MNSTDYTPLFGFDNLENKHKMNVDFSNGKINTFSEQIKNLSTPARTQLAESAKASNAILEAENQKAMNGGTDEKESKTFDVSKWSGVSQLIGQALQQSMGEPDYNVDGINMKTGMKGEANAGWEAVKDGVASAIPAAGIFRGIEKAGKAIGQAIGGDKGGDVAQGFLDPFSNVTRKDTNIGEKALSLLDPVLAGWITASKNKKLRNDEDKRVMDEINRKAKEDRFHMYLDSQRNNQNTAAANVAEKQMKFNSKY